jgi:hypothetical protein
MLFEYLNSSEEAALEIALAAFHHRIELDHQSKMASDAHEDGSKALTSEQSPASNDLLPSGSLLQQYLEHSPETNELWAILAFCLKRDKTKSMMATMLLSCFSSILKFTTWPHLQYLRTNIARTFTKSHIHMCSSNLASESTLLINATFSLLTEIINVSQFHARDLFTAFNWSQKSFFQLVGRKNASYEARKSEIQRSYQADKKTKRPDQTEKEYQRLYLLDIRTHYIQFGLAFLEHDDPSLSQDVLAINGFLSGIFKDMQYDATAVILQTFETLHEHVLLNKAITKTCKTHFFNSWVLTQFATIFKRFTAKDKLGALASLTRRRIQAFLESLLTSSSDGIIYLDIARPFPPAARLLPANEDLGLNASNSTSASQTQKTSRNRNILRFITQLQPQESHWHEKVVLKVLEKDAQLAKQYFDDLRLAIEPRPNNIWLNNITYLIKLLDVRPFDLEALVNAATTENSNFSFDRVVSWYIPTSALQRVHLSAGLRHANISVRFATINLIHRIISTLDDVSNCFQAELSSSSSPGTTLLQQLWEGISNLVKRKIPDLDTVLTIFNAGFSTPTPKPTPLPPPDSEDFTLDVSHDMIHTQIMVLMSAYMKRFPESFLELNFDMGKMFLIADPWLQSLRLQEGLLTMLESAVSRLRWNAPLPASTKTKMTQLGYILRFLISTKDQSIKSRLSKLAQELLLSSGLFDRSPSEAETWIETLSNTFPHISCVNYFEFALSYLNLAPHYWADEMARHIKATDSIELQTTWKLSKFPSSSTVFPFSLLALSIVKDHAHILSNTLGGHSAINTNLSNKETWIEIIQISEFINSTILHILVSSELPLPLIHAVITLSSATTALPSYDTGRGKNEPLSQTILDTPAFTCIFYNMRGFLYKIFGIHPDLTAKGEVPPLGVDLGLPHLSLWGPARLYLHASIFEAGPIAERLGVISVPAGSIPLMEEIDWSQIGAVYFLCHLFSAENRSLLVGNPTIMDMASRVISGAGNLVVSAQVLLFFISTFLEDEHSGKCLHFALHLLSVIFSRSVEKISSGQTIQSSEDASTEPSKMDISKDETSSKITDDDNNNNNNNNNNKTTSATILRLILGNPCLNSHFLKDLSSPASISLNQIIAQLLQTVIIQSAHHLVEEAKELISVPLSKLAQVFSQLLEPKISPSVVHILPLIRASNFFMPSQVYQDIIQSILKVPPKKLLAENGLQLFDLLVQMLLYVSQPNHSSFKLSIPCFKFSSPPTDIAHSVQQTLLPEFSQHSSYFEVPPCPLSTFSSLLKLYSYVTSKASKLDGEAVKMLALLDQVVFRLLLSSFHVNLMPSASSAITSSTNISKLNVENMGLEDSHYVKKLLAPFIPPDFPVLINDELVEEMLKSMRKQLDADPDSSLKDIPMLHRAAVIGLVPSVVRSLESFRKLLSSFSKSVDESIVDAPSKANDVLEDVLQGSKRFLKSLKKVSETHQNHWFMLILLNASIEKGLIEDKKIIAKAFKPFVNLVLTAIIHSQSLVDSGSHLHRLLIEFGAPVLRYMLKKHRSSIMSDKEVVQVCEVFSAIATSKSVFMEKVQLEVISDLFSFDSLTNILVSQAANLLQRALKLKEEEQSNSSAFHQNSELVTFIMSQLQHLSSNLCKLPEMELVKLFRRLLRYGYERTEVLEWIFSILNQIPSDCPSNALYLNLHDLIVSHSSFVKILLTREPSSPIKSNSHIDSNNQSPQLSLLQLLCSVYDNEPEASSKFSAKMLALYMSAYHATLSPQDQLLLHIIMIFERHGINFSHAGFLWGSVAQNYKSTSINTTNTTSKNSSFDTNQMDVDGISGDKEGTDDSTIPSVELSSFHSLLLGGQLTNHRNMLTTIRSFSPRLPMETSVRYMNAEALFPRSGAQNLRTRPSSVYDARFLLSVYLFGMEFFPDFDCKKFVEIGGLSLVFQTLAAFETNLRKLGYSVLASYSKILDKATVPMREAPQMRLLLTVLRAAIAVDNLQLSSIITSFLGEASLVLIRHDHPLFLELHNYLTSRPALSLNSTPILKRFMISARSTSKTEKEWALRMVECGLRAPSDLPLLGLRIAGSSKVINNHILAMMLTHLASNLSSSFASISERHRIWSIVARMLANDAPSYKNTLLGPGGIVPFLALWTSNHSLNSDGFSIVPSASVASATVYAEVSTVLRTIINLPELASTITKSRSLWLQFQPLIGNVLQYLELSYAKLGSLRSASNNPNVTNVKSEVIDEEIDENNASGNNDSNGSRLASNVYWKLLSPCITLLYHFASNLAQHSGVPIAMLNLAAKLVSHLTGTFQPISSHHSIEVSNPSNSASNSIENQENQISISNSSEEIEIANHHLMLSHVILLDKPEDGNTSSVDTWIDLAQYAIRVVLLTPSNSSSRFLSLRTLVGQLSMPSTTSSSNGLILDRISASIMNRKTSESTLLHAILFAYRQHAIHSSHAEDEHDTMLVVLLNTLCTLVLANCMRHKFFALSVDPSWTELLNNSLPKLLKTTHTLGSNTIHELSLHELCNKMSTEEKLSHSKLGLFYRAVLSSDLSYPSTLNLIEDDQ